MPRRRFSQEVGTQRILTRIRAVTESPLKEIGEKLFVVFSELQGSNDGRDVNDFADLALAFDRIVDLFPATYGERFYFDAAMIQASADSLSNQQLTFNPMIVPLHSNKWGHQSLSMPSWSKTDIDMVDFVLFPGQDDVSEVNLLSYPFLLHELGHNILFKYDDPFRSGFKRALDMITNKLALGSIADQGAIRLQSQQSIETVRTYWEPTPDHKNWAYELAIDILALWLTGPAYLAAFIDETDKPGIDPFLLQDHPPYQLRAQALVLVANRIGWQKHCDALNQLLSNWWTSQQTRRTPEVNRYVALSNEEILESCIGLALETCKTLQLPQCTEEVVSKLKYTLGQNDTPELGLDVIIAAWLVHEERGDDAYQVWQSRTIKELQQYITQ
jgi:hypothetical protein